VRSRTDAAEAAALLCGRWRVLAVAITLGSDGAVLGIPGQPPLMAVPPFAVAGDACGAGDQFAGSAALALAAGRLLPEAVEEAVQRASAFVAEGGVGSLDAPGRRAEIDPVAATRAQRGVIVATSGCFDLLHAGHIASLEAARRLGDCLVVLLNSDASVRRLKGPGRPLVPERDRAAVLRALGCVDAVELFDEDTPVVALERLRPDLFAKGGDYGAQDIPEQEAMREWGGQVVIVPYLAGRSTSGLVASVRGES
jgi:D-beta-D-heptose 7-phosphate kinase / D-beta-D-heptose 1-phosphate adenosyltransferase